MDGFWPPGMGHRHRQEGVALKKRALPTCKARPAQLPRGRLRVAVARPASTLLRVGDRERVARLSRPVGPLHRRQGIRVKELQKVALPVPPLPLLERRRKGLVRLCGARVPMQLRPRRPGRRGPRQPKVPALKPLLWDEAVH